MLIFKNNIYNQKELGFAGFSRSPDPNYDLWFDPEHFVEMALSEEEEIISFIEEQPIQYWKEDAINFFPNAFQIGNLLVLRKILEIIRYGFSEPGTWYRMNTYHFCLLHDILARHAFNYNHDNHEERLNTLPELKGTPIQFDLFVKNYFFNTVFLMDPDQYDALFHEEKVANGFDCPCQFGVIHGLTPTREEMELKESKDYPYSIYV